LSATGLPGGTVHVINPRRKRAAGRIDVIPANSGPTDHSQISLTVTDDGGVHLEIGGKGPDAKPQPSGDFDENLAGYISEAGRAALFAHLSEGIEADERSRSDWLETVNKAPKYLGIVLSDPGNASTDGTISKQVATCLLEANIKLWSTARAELLPVGGPVKVKRDDLVVPQSAQMPSVDEPRGIGDNGGPPLDDPAEPPGTPPEKLSRDQLANALEQDLNWYLTKGDREYYPDFSKMLMSRALVGMAFRKVYRCPLRRKPVSVWVKAQNLIVSNDCAHLSGAGRITEVIRMRQAVMKRLQKQGAYLDIALVMPTGETTETEKAVEEVEGVRADKELPGDYDHMLWECSCEPDSSIDADLDILDMDETGKRTGYPMPYRVTMDKDSQAILEIRRDWKQGDPDHRRKQKYVKYGFVPGMGFYDLGLIHIAGNPTMAATMLERSAVDSALFANFPGGLFLQGPGTGMKNTMFRMSPGEWQPVNAGGANDINKVLMPMPYKPPSAESMALKDSLAQKVSEIAGIIDLPVGEGRIGNTPVATIMSYVEAVSQVPSAIHKDDHISQSEEYELLRDLLAEDIGVLTRGNKTPAHKWELAEELLAPDLTAAADPNTPSAIHRLMKLQSMIQLCENPVFAGIPNLRKIFEDAIQLLCNGLASEYMMPVQAAAPPPPDPRVVAAQIKAQSQKESDEAKQQQAALDHQARMAELQQDAQQRDQDRQSAETRAAMSLEGQQLKAAHDANQGAADRAHEAGIAAMSHGAAARQAAGDQQHAVGLAAMGHIADAVGSAQDRQHQAGLAAAQPNPDSPE